MIIPIRGSLIIFIMMLCGNGCNSKSSNGPVRPQTVEWNVDNGPAQTAETISFLRIGGYNYVHASKGTTELFFATTSTAAGSYSSLNSNGTMGLTISGKQYASLSCDIAISSNANSLLKGTFTGTFGLVNVDTVVVAGSFEDVLYN